MDRKRAKAYLTLFAGCVLAASSSANLTFFEVARWQHYTQTSSAQPTSPDQFRFSARVFADTANEVMNGTVTAPSSVAYNMTPSGQFVSAYFHGGHASEAALDAIYGMGTYTFNLTNGPHAGASDSLTYGDPGWADSVPYLTGSSFQDLQNADVSQAIDFAWDPFTAGGTHTVLQTYFTLVDTTANMTVFSQQGLPGTFTSKSFAPNSLTPYHHYRWALLFGSLEQHATTGQFSPATSVAATYIQTLGEFDTVPEPASIGALLAGLGWLALKRRR